MLYEDGVEIRSLKFNTAGTTNLDWFSQENLGLSPWNDLKTASELQHFDIVGGTEKVKRSFEISKNYGGCNIDAGWLVIPGQFCEWEKRLPTPSIQYSKLQKSVLFSDYGKMMYLFPIQKKYIFNPVTFYCPFQSTFRFC